MMVSAKYLVEALAAMKEHDITLDFLLNPKSSSKNPTTLRLSGGGRQVMIQAIVL